MPNEHAPTRRSPIAVRPGALERLVGVAAAGAGGGEHELVARRPAGMEAVAVEHAGHAPGRAARCPRSAAASPSRIRSVVVLPAPLGPRKPQTLPAGTAKLSPSTAAVRP